MNIKSILSKINLTKKMILLYTAIMVTLIFTLSISMFLYFKNTVKESLINSLELVINNNASNVNELFGRIVTATKMINNEPSIAVEAPLAYDGDLIAGVQKYYQFDNRVKDYMEISLSEAVPIYNSIFFVDDNMPLSTIFPNSFKGVCNLQPYGYNSTSFYNNYAVVEDEWFQKTIQMDEQLYWFKLSGNKNLLQVSKLIKTWVSTGNSMTYENMGVIFISFDVSWINKKINTIQLTQGSEVILSDEQDKVLYSNVASNEGRNLQDIIGDSKINNENGRLIEVGNGPNKILVQRTELRGGLNLVTLVPMKDVNNIANGTVRIILIVSFVMLIAGILLIIFISNMMIRPIQRLSKHMRNNTKLETISCKGINEDEIGFMYMSYNDLMIRVDSLIHQVYDLAQQQKINELRVLQAQINPHFIYNTLDSICCISLLRGNEDIAEALSGLANLLRYNIRDPEAFVSIDQELELIKEYIYIQNVQYKGKIQISIQNDIDAELYLIPKLVIQPLVENSVIHGLGYVADQLEIDIRCYEEHDRVYIVVHDNGHDVDIDSINEHLDGKKTISKETGGFGIRNVNQRIRMKFGELYGLHYERGEDGGTEAIVILSKVSNQRRI